MNGCLTEQTTNEWMFNRTDNKFRMFTRTDNKLIDVYQNRQQMNGCLTKQTTNELMFNRTDNKLMDV